MTSPHLNRRHFLAALAASVVAAGAALPIGFPKEAVKPKDVWVRLVVRFADEQAQAKALEEAPWLFIRTGHAVMETAARSAA